MRILLTSNASYDPPRGGSTRSNLAWLRQLAGAGHECIVVCSSAAGDAITARDNIQIRAFRDLARRTEVLRSAIAELIPDWVLVTSEDVGHTLLREAAHAAPGRLIFLAHTPQWFPFGPESWHPDPIATELVRGARAVIAIGRHMARYIEQHLGVRPLIVHPPIYGRPPFPRLGQPNGFVLMINPAEVKGIRIFAALAERFPRLRFAALAGWGTTRPDREMLERLPNVEMLETVPDIDDVLARAGVLLMPSLWYEGFGLIAMEAMLRGLPVIASDSGGLQEAKHGTNYVLPVRPITEWLREFDENGMPKPVIPDQDIEPWVDALGRLTGDPIAYHAESEASREAALQFVSAVDPAGLERVLESLRPEPLRILLAHNSLYFGSHGGGDRSNRILMESLAARGHTVRVVARVEQFGEESHARFVAGLTTRGIMPDSLEGGVVRVRLNGVEVHTLTANPRLRSYFEDQIAAFDPDVIITSTDDPAQLLFGIAIGAPRARVVHLVRATIAVPFGPDASSPNTGRTSILGRADGIVTVSEYVARYVREHAGLDAIHLPISLPEQGPFPSLGRFESQDVTMVNPCAVKGIAMFLRIADELPRVQFAAVPTWGATAQDLADLRARPNIEILPASDNIDDILRTTRVLLVPSVWAEARSRIVLEAMARGVPVISSQLGGLPEAKLGVPYIVPVKPIRGYLPTVDENMVPVADVPEQDAGPWVDALQRLLSDRGHWTDLSESSRRAALEYTERATAWPFEAFLWSLTHKSKKPAPDEAPVAEHLSPERKKLIALLLKKRVARKTNAWFPGIEAAPADRMKLFCFPHAGAGTAAYSAWAGALPGTFVAPARLPGRESRIEEPAIDNMEDMVRALADVIAPWTHDPFAFFGHSMGAGIAFELARELRRRELGLPQALIVSGTRAPQLRTGWTPGPEPSDTELLAELSRLDGVPSHLLSDPAALALALPALRGDLRLYRMYRYTAEDALPVSIAAYCGTGDPNVTPEQMRAWNEQTSAGFRFREFPGGHFYLHAARQDVLRVLAEDLLAMAPA